MPAKNRRVDVRLFSSLMEKGNTRSGRYFSIRFRKNPEGGSHFSVAVGKKVQKTAVTRNRLRRRINEALRAITPLSAGRTLPPVDCIIFAKKGAETLSFADLKKEVAALLQLV